MPFNPDNPKRTRALNCQEAADYIGMSTKWLWEARAQRSMNGPPYVKIGRNIRYLKDDLDRWLEQYRQ